MESTKDGQFFASPDSSGFFLVDHAVKETLETTSRYQIQEEIGRGGMGVVFRARDLDLNRSVAIKVLLRDFRASCNEVNRFIYEARIVGMLQHPGIAQVYEYGTTSSGRPFYTMKLVGGMTFGQLLDERDESEAVSAQLLSVFSLVCQTMSYTHSKGLIHLDLKPANIMVGEFGEVHVMDWGLAKALDPDVHDELNFDEIDLTKPEGSNGVHGTLQYMAPEQARGERVDRRTDVFCLGAILCHVLTGQPPYNVKDGKSALLCAQSAKLQSAFERLDHCGAKLALVRLAKRCLCEDPDDRPEDAGELVKELAVYNGSALQRVRNDMTRFFELSLDLFCIAGFDGYFRRINSNFSLVLGYSDEELLARPFMSFVAPEDQSRTIEVMGKLLHGLSVVRFRNRYLTKDGGVIKFEWTAKSMLEENVIFAVARNVS